MNVKKRRWAGLMCLVWLLLTLLPPTAVAQGGESTQGGCAMTVRYPCGGVTFRLYRVGSAQEGNYILTGDFTAYPVSLSGLDTQGWAGAAEMLDAYAVRDGLEPLKTEVTDEDGTLTFSGLTPGLYLVSWSRHTTDGVVYTPQPFFTEISPPQGQGAETSTVTVTPKYEKTPISPASSIPPASGGAEMDEDYDTVTCRVRLLWGGGNSAAFRSLSATAQLLRDGKVYRETVLNEANDWSYEWKGLNGRYTWRVIQKDVPEGFTVTADRDGFTFILINTPVEEPAQAADDPNISPVLSDSPAPDESFAPGPSGEVNASPGPAAPVETDPPSPPVKPEEPDESKIPQTGQLWWPVPLLTLAGLALYLLGWWRARRDDYEK